MKNITLITIGLISTLMITTRLQSKELNPILFDRISQNLELPNGLKVKLNKKIHRKNKVYYHSQQQFTFNDNNYHEIFIEKINDYHIQKFLINKNRKEGYYSSYYGEQASKNPRNKFECDGKYIMVMLSKEKNTFEMKCIKSHI